jgi:hypothetical protein
MAVQTAGPKLPERLPGCQAARLYLIPAGR